MNTKTILNGIKEKISHSIRTSWLTISRGAPKAATIESSINLRLVIILKEGIIFIILSGLKFYF